MSRVSHVPYHQNVYDLIGIEPGECPDAAQMITEHEVEHGPLPEALREWYHIPNVVLLSSVGWTLEAEAETFWHEIGGEAHPHPLDEVLADFAALTESPEPARVAVLTEQQGGFRWYINVDGSDDPAVWIGPSDVYDQKWTREADHFSEFIWEWVSEYYPVGVTSRRLLEGRPPPRRR